MKDVVESVTLCRQGVRAADKDGSSGVYILPRELCSKQLVNMLKTPMVAKGAAVRGKTRLKRSRELVSGDVPPAANVPRRPGGLLSLGVVDFLSQGRLRWRATRKVQTRQTCFTSRANTCLRQALCDSRTTVLTTRYSLNTNAMLCGDCRALIQNVDDILFKGESCDNAVNDETSIIKHEVSTETFHKSVQAQCYLCTRLFVRLGDEKWHHILHDRELSYPSRPVPARPECCLGRRTPASYLCYCSLFVLRQVLTYV